MTEKELKRYIKNKEEQFCWKKNKKIGGVKVRNGNGQQSENERQWKKKKTEQGRKQQNFWWAHTIFPK